MTRQNPVPFKNSSGEVSGRVLALVPVMDMANHDPTLDHGTFYDDETDEICVAASSALCGGDELRMYYGDRSNQELLVHCGLWQMTTGMIELPYLYASQNDDPLFKLRMAVLRQQDILGRQTSESDWAPPSVRDVHFEFDIQHGGASRKLITF